MPIVAGRFSFSSGGGDGCEWNEKKTREDAAARRHSPSSKTRTHARTPARLPLNTFSCAPFRFVKLLS
jgi:hypothetical protein